LADNEPEDSLKLIPEEKSTTGSFKVYPVPADDKIIIQAGEFGPVTKIVFSNELGSQIKVVAIERAEGQIEINVSDLSPGYYYMSVEGDGKSKVEKILISRK
jgi:hypothetical protein